MNSADILALHTNAYLICLQKTQLIMSKQALCQGS